MNLAWIDLETTGSDEHAGSLLEVACIVTDLDLTEHARMSWLVEPDLAHVATMDRVVREMHTANGLLDALDRHRAADHHAATRVVLTPAEVDSRLAALLDGTPGEGKAALAGSGVAHFDRRWIDVHLPATAERLRYWTMDVGVVRRFVSMLAGRRDLVDERPDRPDVKAHRALDDAADHLDEARWLRDAIAAGLHELVPPDEPDTEDVVNGLGEHVATVTVHGPTPDEARAVEYARAAGYAKGIADASQRRTY